MNRKYYHSQERDKFNSSISCLTQGEEATLFLTTSGPGCVWEGKRWHWGNWSTDWPIDQDKKLIKRTTAWSPLWSVCKVKVMDFNDLKDPSCFQILESVKEKELREGKRRRDGAVSLIGPYSLSMAPCWALVTFRWCLVTRSWPRDEGPLFHLLFNLNGRERGVGWRFEDTILSDLTLLY